MRMINNRRRFQPQATGKNEQVTPCEVVPETRFGVVSGRPERTVEITRTNHVRTRRVHASHLAAFLNIQSLQFTFLSRLGHVPLRSYICIGESMHGGIQGSKFEEHAVMFSSMAVRRIYGLRIQPEPHG
jgi:hypothetical protein